MNDWGEFELEKKGGDWRISAKGWPAIAITLAGLGWAFQHFFL